jgi:hypothetical protein
VWAAVELAVQPIEAALHPWSGTVESWIESFDVFVTSLMSSLVMTAVVVVVVVVEAMAQQ